MFGDIPIECNTKSILPFKCFWASSKSRSKSSTDVASAGIIFAFVFSLNLFISPARNAIEVFVSIIEAPSSTVFSATFQAIESSFKAPKIIPRFFLVFDYS